MPLRYFSVHCLSWATQCLALPRRRSSVPSFTIADLRPAAALHRDTPHCLCCAALSGSLRFGAFALPSYPTRCPRNSLHRLAFAVGFTASPLPSVPCSASPLLSVRHLTLLYLCFAPPSTSTQHPAWPLQRDAMTHFALPSLCRSPPTRGLAWPLLCYAALSGSLRFGAVATLCLAFLGGAMLSRGGAAPNSAFALLLPRGTALRSTLPLLFDAMPCLCRTTHGRAPAEPSYATPLLRKALPGITMPLRISRLIC